MIRVTHNGSQAYIYLGSCDAQSVAESVPLDIIADTSTHPNKYPDALQSLVLDFDYSGRLVGIEITGDVESVLLPTMRNAA